MATAESNSLAIAMEDMVEKFRKTNLSSRQNSQDYVDVKDEDYSDVPESLDIVGGKPMETYPRALFEPAPPAYQLSPDEEHLVVVRKAFACAVAQYFTYYVLLARTHSRRTDVFLHDNWRKMCDALNKDGVHLLFDKSIQTHKEKHQCEQISSFEFDHMWHFLSAKYDNWLRSYIYSEVRKGVYAKQGVY